MSRKLDSLSIAIFEPLLDSDFVLHLDSEHTVNAKLIEVTPLPPATTREDLPIRKDPFSLVFKVVADVEFDQGTYRLEHESNGIMEMFFVPIGFGEYESIFN